MSIYKNGNTIVEIRQDGTKIRYTPDLVEAKPEYPESIDLKITNHCEIGCPMCFAAGTKVLMADYTYKNIEEIKIGDEVVGFKESADKQGAKRRIEKATVLNTFIHVESELIKVKTSEGNEIVSTPNHPFLSKGTGQNHSRKFTQIGRLKIGDQVYAYGFPVDSINYSSIDYAIGYVVGSWVGDGSLYHSTDKNGFDAYSCRFVTLDEEINDRVAEMTAKLSNDFYRSEFKMKNHEDTPSISVRSNKRSAYEFLTNLIKTHIGSTSSKEYCCGYLAGFCDSEGHVDNQRGVIRLANTTIDYLKECERTLDILGIENKFEEYIDYNNSKKNFKPKYNVRIVGKYGASKFLWYTRPVCKRKSFENYISTTTQYHTDSIESMEPVDKKQYVYNLETSSHTYIANNFMVHNCHEQSMPDGVHGNLNHPIIDSLRPFTEVAIGGGDPMSHPELEKFLEQMKARNVIANLTVHWKTFVANLNKLKEWERLGFIHGLGISVNEIIPEDVVNEIASFKNAVVHVVIGVADDCVFKQFYDKNVNILLLGYKTFGRGEHYRTTHSYRIKILIDWVKTELTTILNKFRAVSFDNLAIQQLELKGRMSKEEFNQFYMGGDGTFTMYVDLVKREYAVSSTSYERYAIDSNDIADLFNNVRKVRKK